MLGYVFIFQSLVTLVSPGDLSSALLQQAGVLPIRFRYRRCVGSCRNLCPRSHRCALYKPFRWREVMRGGDRLGKLFRLFVWTPEESLPALAHLLVVSVEPVPCQSRWRLGTP